MSSATSKGRKARQVTGRGLPSRANARDLRRFLPEFILSLAEGVEMTSASLCSWRLGARKFLELVLSSISREASKLPPSIHGACRTINDLSDIRYLDFLREERFK